MKRVQLKNLKSYIQQIKYFKIYVNIYWTTRIRLKNWPTRVLRDEGTDFIIIQRKVMVTKRTYSIGTTYPFSGLAEVRPGVNIGHTASAATCKCCYLLVNETLRESWRSLMKQKLKE